MPHLLPHVNVGLRIGRPRVEEAAKAKARGHQRGEVVEMEKEHAVMGGVWGPRGEQAEAVRAEEGHMVLLFGVGFLELELDLLK